MDPVGRLERLLDATARRLTGGEIHPIELLDRIATALRSSASDGVMPNDITVGLAARDSDAYGEAHAALTVEIEALADRVAREDRLRRIGPLHVTIEESPDAGAGDPVITVRFAERPRDASGFPIAIGEPTRRLRRQTGAVIALSDGTRVPLTHTPFTIGRGPGNDLVVASLAVSRQHAEIVAVAGGYAIRDLGGRNGLVLAGTRVPHADLDPGISVELGDLALWIEGTAE